MNDLVERLTYPEWTASKNYKAGEQGNPRLLDSKAPYEAAARITELEAEVKRLRDGRREIYEAGFNDGLTGVYSATTTDPAMASFHEPHRGNGAVPYAPTEEA